MPDHDASAARGRVRVERGSKRVRAYLGGELVADSQKIAGLIASYNEKLDIEVDGVRQPRPSTKFS